ncbi:non-canonical purine NTP pyrophosphatase [Candidatus Peregrinibacteria bacterium]|nr:non-canonical purine NTP pyrophosphatase [Candidatus Peregrinibacteria bacterium]
MNFTKLLIATQNIGKFGEIKEVLGSLPLELYHLKLDDFSTLLQDDTFEEHGSTFEENAELKAMHYHELIGIPTIGEDSGIIVDALKGELGVKTRRWGAGANATDEEWIEHFMNVMKDIPQHERTARFVSAAAFKNGDGEVAMFRGQTEGIITMQMEAPLKPGIPLSSCFKPKGKNKVYAALSEKEKNQISHRGKAFHELKQYLSYL